jgi:hypothetical protein
MKITKSQLREIIREEIQQLKQPKMSTRLKELINKGWVLSEDNQTVTNPKTGRKIKIKTALSYPSDHPAHQAAKKAKGSTTSSVTSTSSSSVGVDTNAWKMKVKKDRYGDTVREFPQSAADNMESILNSITGGDSMVDINYDTGGMIYNLPNNDDRTITMGTDERGRLSVQVEDFEDSSVLSKTSKTFKTPQEAMDYAVQLAKTYNK